MSQVISWPCLRIDIKWEAEKSSCLCLLNPLQTEQVLINAGVQVNPTVTWVGGRCWGGGGGCMILRTQVGGGDFCGF